MFKPWSERTDPGTNAYIQLLASTLFLFLYPDGTELENIGAGDRFSKLMDALDHLFQQHEKADIESKWDGLALFCVVRPRHCLDRRIRSACINESTLGCVYTATVALLPYTQVYNAF